MGPDAGGAQLAAMSKWKPRGLAPLRQAPESKAGLYLVLAYLLFEFGRPQEIVPGLRAIPFGTGLSVLILLNVLMSGKLDFSRAQTKLWIPLLAVMAVHVPLAVNNFWALMTFKDMFLLFCVYLGIITFVNSIERMMVLMKLWMGIHGFLAVMGVVKGGVGIGAWMGDENDFCMVMDMAVPFGYFLLLGAQGLRDKVRYLGFLGAFILAAMASLSRGGFIGLASVGVYCWYRSPKKLNALILAVVAVVFMVLLAPDKYWDEISSTTSDQTLQTGTGAERLYTWGIGVEMFYYNPIIGVGQSNFPWTFGEYEEGRRFNEKSISGRQAHSAWITLISELGLAGFLIIGGMLLQCYKDLKFVRTKSVSPVSRQTHGQTIRAIEGVDVYLARAMEGSLIGYIVSSVFISTLWYPSMWIMMALIVALRNIAVGSRGDESVAVSPLKKVRGTPGPMFGNRTDRPAW